MSPTIHRIGMITLSTAIALVAFAGLAAAGLAQPAPSSTPPVGGAANAAEFSASATEGKIVVAFVLGASGSEAADVLAPYDVLTSSPDFAVYTIADSTAPAPLDGGIWVSPDYTFADAGDGTAPSPDLIVVPAVNLPGEPIEEGARDFIKDEYAAGTRVLGICAGSRLLAASGILDGLSATSHWSYLSQLEDSNPAVSWLRGERYVQDGRVTTTGGVTSGIPGTLKVMADLAGAPEAGRVGKLIDYPGWTPDSSASMPKHSWGLGDLPVLVNGVFPWGRPTFDIELSDGVDEIDAAALFEMYSYSQAGSTHAVSASGTVRTRHGLTLRTEVLDAATEGITLTAGSFTSRGGRGGFDAAFEQLAQNVAPSVVASVSKMIEYPLDRVDRDQTFTWQQWRSSALLAAAAVLAIAAGFLPVIVRRIRGRR